jgi:hypothetical protein
VIISAATPTEHLLVKADSHLRTAAAVAGTDPEIAYDPDRPALDRRIGITSPPVDARSGDRHRS